MVRLQHCHHHISFGVGWGGGCKHWVHKHSVYVAWLCVLSVRACVCACACMCVVVCVCVSVCLSVTLCCREGRHRGELVHVADLDRNREPPLNLALDPANLNRERSRAKSSATPPSRIVLLCQQDDTAGEGSNRLARCHRRRRKPTSAHSSHSVSSPTDVKLRDFRQKTT